MSLSCDMDYENYIEFGDEMATSIGTEFCVECGKLITVGEEHYIVRLYTYDEDGEEVHLAKHKCCEECGDLALSVLELGYCWTFGDIRNDIKEMRDYG